MTEYEHLEISRKLALAIGWKPDLVFIVPNGKEKWLQVGGRVFDYRSETIAFRVAERFGCFPERVADVWWVKQTCDAWVDVEADTPQLAIALAVIAAQGVK